MALSPINTSGAASPFGTPTVKLHLGRLVETDGYFAARITIDTGKESVNAVELRLGFSKNDFRIVSIQDGNSIINGWVDRPTIDESAGTVSFSGIVPGGFSGADGLVATLLVEPRAAGTMPPLQMTGGMAFRNDGLGTPLAVSFDVEPWLVSEIPTSSNRLLTAEDRRPPEEFMPEIVRDRALFDGRAALVFMTEDKQTGIERYDVLEVPAGLRHGDVSGWHEAESPYLLLDQALRSDIYVRAVDYAGNFRIVSVPAPSAPRLIFDSNANTAVALGAFLILLGGITLWLIRRYLRVRS